MFFNIRRGWSDSLTPVVLENSVDWREICEISPTGGIESASIRAYGWHWLQGRRRLISLSAAGIDSRFLDSRRVISSRLMHCIGHDSGCQYAAQLKSNFHAPRGMGIPSRARLTFASRACSLHFIDSADIFATSHCKDFATVSHQLYAAGSMKFCSYLGHA